MTHNSKQVNAVAACIADTLTISQIIALHNEFCDKHGDPDSIIYQMGEFNEILSGTDPDDITRMMYYGKFNPNDDYFCFDGYANLASFNSYDDDESPIYLSELAEYVIDYGADGIESNNLIPAFLEFAGIEDTHTNEIQISDALFMSGDDLVTADWDELKKSLYTVEIYLGIGIGCETIYTIANNGQCAIERVMVYCQKETNGRLYITEEERENIVSEWEPEERERYEEDYFLYIDPTREDNTCVPAYFVWNNVCIRKLTD